MVKCHDCVARNLYYCQCVKYGFMTHHYKQDLEGHQAHGNIEIYWKHQLVTKPKVPHNRSNMVVINRGKQTV
uniref:Uncharacterized protein n=1 Tax=Romanomermis culicivorax TaxID=13658 RepID=A0A915K1M1_ROMCU